MQDSNTAPQSAFEIQRAIFAERTRWPAPRADVLETLNAEWRVANARGCVVSVENLHALWKRRSATGHAPETWEETLEAARAGRLYEIDTASAGEDSLLDAESPDAALAEVATHYLNGAPDEADAAEWARAHGWTAARIAL